MSVFTPRFGTEILGHLTAWWHGGAQRAWAKSFWWAFSHDEKTRKKARRLAELLYDANISSVGIERAAFSHYIDKLRLIRAPMDTDWDLLRPEQKKEFSEIWKTFEMALERGFDVNYQHQNNYYDTPLHQAAVAGRVYLTELLLRYGADPNKRDGNGYTVLAATLTGFNEMIAGQEQREKIARKLLDHPKIDLTLGRERRTFYKISEEEVRKYEEGILEFSRDFPELLVEMTRRGAPLSWELANHEISKYQVYGDQSVGSVCHALFLMNHAIWETPNESLRSEWIALLKQREGNLSKLRSHRGFTPAMEFISNRNLVGGNRFFESEEDAVENIRSTIQYFVDNRIFNLTDKTDGGSNIWHALLMDIDKATLVKVKALMEHFPETHALLTEENEGGVKPRDILRYYLDGSPQHIVTSRGSILANSRTHYDKSWYSTFNDILAAIDRQSLQQHVITDVKRKELVINNKPRL